MIFWCVMSSLPNSATALLWCNPSWQLLTRSRPGESERYK